MQAAKKGMGIFVLAAIVALSAIGRSEARRGTEARKAPNDPCQLDIKEATRTCSPGQIEDRWGYNSSAGTCVKFHSASCDRNSNNFETAKQCLEKCNKKSRCLKEPDSSKFGFLNRYYFDANATECKPMKSLPKLGNGKNRFKKKEDCENKCMPSRFVVIRSYTEDQWT
ncbi:hypothetical protein MTO96_034440 [Rhipicephalus appendiculatus]|uniref:Pancreatic trypsin inhibitor n=1 Tax=Rhipicephalus appendiculatus TaxID=34631 RepID=A0A131YUB9_RHIAP